MRHPVLPWPSVASLRFEPHFLAIRVLRWPECTERETRLSQKAQVCSATKGASSPKLRGFGLSRTMRCTSKHSASGKGMGAWAVRRTRMLSKRLRHTGSMIVPSRAPRQLALDVAALHLSQIVTSGPQSEEGIFPGASPATHTVQRNISHCYFFRHRRLYIP